MLSKCIVTGPFNRPDGTPFAKARLSFKLSGRDREDDITVMPAPVFVTTDANGDFSVELWPNSEGYAGTHYMASVVGFAPWRVVVPDAPTAELALISDLVPPQPVDDLTAALDEVRQIGATVTDILVIRTEIEAVYALSNEIEGVYGVRAAISTLSPIATQIVGVYAARIAVVGVFDNLAAINSLNTNTAALLAVPGEAAASATAASGAAGAATGAATAAEASRAATAAIEGNVATYAAQFIGYRDEAMAYSLQAMSYASNAAQTAAALTILLGSIPSMDGVAAAMLGSSVRSAGTDFNAACLWLASDDEYRAVKRGETQRSYFAEALGTATRGSRRDLPLNKHVVGRPTVLTVNDADSGGALWKSWVVAGLTSVVAAAGFLLYGGTGGLYRIDFIRDEVTRRSTAGIERANQNVANFNQGTATWTVVDATKPIGNNTINALCSYLPPLTPVDIARRLPTPLFGIATGAGSFVTHYDERVTASSVTSVHQFCAFAADGTFWCGANTATTFATPVDYMLTAWSSRSYSATTIPSFTPALNHTSVMTGGGIMTKTINGKVSLLRHTPGSGFVVGAQSNRSMVADITTRYNTGWELGDVKFAGAESSFELTVANDTTLQGADDFSSYADTAALQAAWNGGTTGVTLALSAGTMQMTKTAAAAFTQKTANLAGVIGRVYRIEYDFTVVSGTGTIVLALAVSNSAQGQQQTVTVGQSGRHRSFYTAGGTTNYNIGPRLGGTSTDAVVRIDNFVIIEQMISDRSGLNNHPVVSGSVQRQVVAAGADLAGYVFPTTSDYLTLPYTSALDLAGDFEVATIVVATGSAARTLVGRGYYTVGAFSGIRWRLEITAGNKAQFLIDNNGAGAVTVTGTSNINDGRAHRVCAKRRLGNFEMWVDGRLEASVAVGAYSGALTNTNAILRFGLGVDGGNGAGANVVLALPRIQSAGTPAQERQAAAEEIALAQPGVKGLLSGSDNVQDSAYDALTGLMYFAKAAYGTDVFSGLCRVDMINRDSVNGYGPNLVTNGDFAVNTNGWTPAGSTTLSVVNGRMRVTANGGVTGADQMISGLTPGDLMEVQSYNWANVGGGSNANLRVGSTLGGLDLVNTAIAINSEGLVKTTFTVPAGGVVYIRVVNAASTPLGAYNEYDNIQLRKVTSLRMTSDNHKKVSAENDNVAIVTDQEYFARTPRVGMREGLLRRPAVLPYDRTYAMQSSVAVTPNATPFVITHLPMAPGEAGTWVVRVSAREYGEPAAPEMASYSILVTAHRPQEGNVAISGSPTITVVSETTATMDVTVAANTTTQSVTITATGVAAKNIEWGREATFIPAIQQVAA